MKNTILLFLVTVVILSSCDITGKKRDDLPKLASGELIRIDSFPSKHVTPRTVDIWLPDGYSHNEEYAVLYMHDGQALFDASKTWNNQEWMVDETIGKLMDENKIKKTIVVGIWNSDGGRHSDYFPQKPFESLDITLQDSLLNYAKRYNASTLFANGIQSDNYLKFITSELIPYINQNYNEFESTENTFIAGSSMGGLISMYAICEYPFVFGGAACMSTHWVGTFTNKNNPIPDAFIDYLAQNLPEPGQNRIYFDYGTATLDSLYEPYQLKVDSVMRLRGYDSTNWVTLKFDGENHTERAWASRFDVPMEFLLSK